MARIRKIKRWGNSFVILLKPSDIKDLDIDVIDDEIDIDDVVVIKKKSADEL